jgi:hypothetical protein
MRFMDVFEVLFQIMTGGPVRSRSAQDRGSSCPVPAAVPEQRRRNTLDFHRFQRRADTAL